MISLLYKKGGYMKGNLLIFKEKGVFFMEENLLVFAKKGCFF